MPVDERVLEQIALSPQEYRLIVERLDREPNAVELGMFGALWSEHCGYKNSKPLLRLFPNTSEWVLVKAGEENAGAIDIGDGLAVVMKVESHNHPSAIEPYEGAATGVGGIVRDIFAMGARPIAILDSLRFGPLTEPRNRYLFGGVVGGIGGYGNCLGIPTVGGEVFFDPSYSANPLVNAMCVGVIESRKLVKATAKGAGNLLMLVGADTGRDGIGGANVLASRELDAKTEERRPTVQVGNPFMEKLLLEACLELVEADYIIGLQDLGAAGLTSSSVECAAKGGSGIEIDVSLVPRRETGMTPYEVMLSESQERMLVVVKKGHEDKVTALFDRWGLRSNIIGHVTDDGLARIRDGERVVAEVPVQVLADPPLYRRQGVVPSWLPGLQSFDPGTLPDLDPTEVGPVLLRLLAAPNIASKEWVFRQYDHQVLTNTVLAPGGDAAVLRIKGTRKAIAVTTDGNGRYCYLDPYTGGAIAVAEAARNLVCTGARPLAVTDCLNFGNPEKLEVYYQLEEAIKGMAEACRALSTPVISGNVSLYNETEGQAVYPTPVIGMVGLLEDVDRHCTAASKDEGDAVFLLGDAYLAQSSPETGLGGSEYLALVHDKVGGRPHLDLDLEKRVQALCLAAIQQGLLKSAHDCAEGGLAVTLAESAVLGNIGVNCAGFSSDGRLDAALFGERQSRIVVSVVPEHVSVLQSLASEHKVPVLALGTVGGERLCIGRQINVSVSEAERAWRHGLEEALG
ncbi:MAG TPA: phosphoribosylformylglycinamidine synthase subunit PurL [Dehalococcoidia bacterium]|nr:phosphoribosylformylglycinamidine synthase subunit PurL [Dehalococcoidia bacterium]